MPEKEYATGDIAYVGDKAWRLAGFNADGSPDWQEYDDGGGELGGTATGISATPEVDRNIKLMPWLPDETSPSLPFSMLDVAEALPGIGGALGAALGVPGGPVGMAGGGALGSAGGESFRQLFRRAAGYAPATGMVQESLDLDPSSVEAALAGLGAEGLVGGATELVSTPLARQATKRLMKRGTTRLVDAITPQSSRAEREGLQELVEKAGIGEQLPGPGVNPLRAQQHMADELEDLANLKGADVGTRYDDPTPRPELGEDFAGVEGTLRKKARAREFTPEHKTTEDVTVPATYEGVVAEREAGALDVRADLVRSQREAAASIEKPYTLKEMHRLAKASAKDARDAAAQAFKFGQRDQPVAAKAIAALEERGELSRILHKTSPESGVRGEANWVPSGEEVDRIFHATKTAAEQARGGRPASHFVERWVLSRMIGGPLGTAVGGIAQSSAFWSALRGKNYQRIAKLIQSGNDAGAEQIIRGIAASMGDEGVPEEDRDIGSGG